MSRARGEYELLGALGAGGMGVVYRAYHRSTGAEVAVKTVACQNGVAVEALYREVQALGRLSHPGIIRIVDHGIADGLPWYAMELLRGRTLREHFDAWFERPVDAATRDLSVGRPSCPTPEEPPPSILPTVDQRSTLLGIARRLCDALTELHSAGLVHGDLNPANIFIQDDGQPVLFDFGLALQFRREDGRAPLEAAGQVRGTFDYMAPEQVEGAPLDARADLYALGCTLFEGLTGQRVFAHATGVSVLRRHLSEPPRRPSSLVADLPPALDELVLGLLAKSPAQRIGYAEDVAVVLDALDPARKQVRNLTPKRARTYIYRPTFHGRARELVCFDGLLRRLSKGVGGVCFLVGESGSGKTSLMSELATQARHHAARTVMCECLDVGVGGATRVAAPALHPLRPLLRAIANDCLNDDLFRARVLGEREETLHQYEPSLRGSGGAVLALEGGPRESAGDRVLRDLGATLEAYAREQPLLLCLDDLQWADALTIRFLTTTHAGFFARRGILVVGSVRSTEVPPGLERVLDADGVTRIDVGALDRASVQEMVQDMLALPSPPPHLVEFLHLNAGGNPLFIAEYLHAAVDEGLVVRDKGRWILEAAGRERIRELATPESVYALVLRRFGLLNTAERGLAEAAAVLGRRCTPAQLWFTADMNHPVASATLESLTRAHVLQVGADDRVHFIHDRVRESIYYNLTEDARRTLHRRAALALEDSLAEAEENRLIYPQLAHHLRESGQREQASYYFELAGFSALAGAATRDAREHLLQALSLGGGASATPVRAARLHRALAEACLGLGELTQMTTHLERALGHVGVQLPENERARARFIAAATWLQLRRSLRPSAHELHDAHAKELAREACLALQLLSIRYVFDDDAPNVIMASLAAVNFGEAAGGQLRMASPYAALGYVARLARLRPVADHYFRMATDSAKRACDLDDHAEARNNEAAAALGAADWHAAEPAVDDALSLAQRARNPQQEEVARTVRFYVDYFRGRYEHALGSLPPLLESATARGNAQHIGWGLVMRGTVAQERGDLNSAERDLEEARRLLGSVADRVTETLCIGLLAGVKARRGCFEEALALSQEAATRISDKFPVVFSVAKGFEGAALAPLLAWQAASDQGKPAGDLPARAYRACQQYLGYGRIFPVGAPGSHVMFAWARRLAGDRLRARYHGYRALALGARLEMPFAAASAHAQLASLEPTRSFHAERSSAGFARLGILAAAKA